MPDAANTTQLILTPLKAALIAVAPRPPRRE